MKPDAKCTCGHAYDEHRALPKGSQECDAIGCDCLAFEQAEDDEED